jgi:oligopeptide/dipeptide ABC transporter ATP-binding protein
MTEPLLQVDHVSKLFAPRGPGLLARRREAQRALDDISFDVRRGETLGIVGESGSGKTTLARLIVGLTTPSTGKISFEGRDINALDRRQTKALRREMQLVFQDPYGSLDPKQSVFDILAEPARVHRLCDADALEARARETLELVGLPSTSEFLMKVPSELSGGERQRIGIGRCLTIGAHLIVADEPVSMLDASVKAGIVALLMDLKRTRALTFILITHELALAYRTCDRIAVMHAGRLVELGPSEAVVRTPRHPYSQLLMDSIPPLVPDPGWVALERDALAPPAADACCPDGCAYYTSCPRKADICRVKRPPFLEVGAHHFLACHPDSARDEG